MKQEDPNSVSDFGFFYALIRDFVSITRLNKPVGIYLLLAPVWVSLLFAHHGTPPLTDLVIFTLGVIIMRSFGCIINDWADRDFDKRVQRTQNRLLTQGHISSQRAWGFALFLLLSASSLLLFLPWQTQRLAVIPLFLACLYPFTKRFYACPQAFLGLAFASAVPMVFSNSPGNWLYQPLPYLLVSSILTWVLVYDTQYAMVDRADDIKIGISSSAIWFGSNDRLWIGIFQLLTLFQWILIGKTAGMPATYHLGLMMVLALFLYQQRLCFTRAPMGCFSAFTNNQYVGLAWVLSTYAGYLVV